MYIKFQSQRAIIWQERVVTKSPILAFSKLSHIRASQGIVQVCEVLMAKPLVYAQFIPNHPNHAFLVVFEGFWKFLKNEDFLR